MSSNSVCNHTRGHPILFITRMITDRIGLHSVILPLSTIATTTTIIITTTTTSINTKINSLFYILGPCPFEKESSLIRKLQLTMPKVIMGCTNGQHRTTAGQ